MKRCLSLLVILAMLAVPACAELSDLSLEELQTRAAQIQAEIYTRMGDGFEIYPGQYVVGEDILPGKYRVETVKSYGIVKVRNEQGRIVLSEFLSATDPNENSIIGKVTLEAGMTVEIESTVFRFVPYKGIMP